MIQAFVSRPNWNLPVFQKWIDAVYVKLSEVGIGHKTIGVNVQAISCPMDEVIELMNKCDGTIVFGLPQSIMNKGKIKGSDFEGAKWYGTDWNQIEGAISLSLGKPTLIIKWKGMSGGIFDRGSCNAFLHEIESPSLEKINDLLPLLHRFKDKCEDSSNVGKRVSGLSRGNSELVENDGVLWKRRGEGFEKFPRCPECANHPPMMEFPPGSNEMWACPANHTFSYDVAHP